ncbi:general stress protein [Vibrio taketomensis]|uniref:general stress protein n=1 Tax=Vibrio taketomensis TaxID=2572923 RepID=UPI001389DBE2|nr:general stress protein [Vibrio taketomensis]
MKEQDKVITIVNTHSEAEEIVKMLQKEQYDVSKISILGKGYHSEEHVAGFYNTGDRVKTWGKTGAFWGGLWGALVGAGMFWLPGVGALMVAGPIVTTVVGAIEGAVVTGGAGAIGGALASIGIPKDSIVKYESAIKADKFLVIVHGDAEDTVKARAILADYEAEHIKA